MLISSELFKAMLCGEHNLIVLNFGQAALHANNDTKKCSNCLLLRFLISKSENVINTTMFSPIPVSGRTIPIILWEKH